MKPPGRGAATILVVEDERIVAHDLADILAGLGYRVELAASADAALACARAAQPQLVLMDIRLSGPVDGITAASQICAEHEVPIVYLTAHADRQTLTRANATHPYAYLVKPFREAELRCTVEVALHKHEADRKRRDHEQRVAHAQLEAAHGELEAFGASVARDLRAPLRSMDRFSQALLDDHAAALAPAGLADLARVRAAAQRMSTLLDASLRLARIAAVTLERRPVNVSALAWSIDAELRTAQPERAVTLQLQPDMVLDGDFGLVRVLLENLIGNAWKFGARRPTTHIMIGSEPRGERTMIYIRDDGPGIDPRDTGRAFALSHRLDAELAGAGVGLAIAQRIVHRHGGEIWLDSVLGHGATFSFAW